MQVRECSIPSFYSIDFDDKERDALDCERIANTVSRLLPGLGVMAVSP